MHKKDSEQYIAIEDFSEKLIQMGHILQSVGGELHGVKKSGFSVTVKNMQLNYSSIKGDHISLLPTDHV